MQVQMADFQAEPITCTVTGSAFPGLTRQMLLDKLAATEQPARVQPWQEAWAGALMAREEQVTSALGRSACARK